MIKIYLMPEKMETVAKISSYLDDGNFEIHIAEGELEDILTQIHHIMPDVILIDNEVKNCEFIIRQIKSPAKNQNTQIILLINNNIQTEYMNLADGLIQYPIDKNILLSTINSHEKIKKSLDRLYENNKELSKSLYQLNVLYNTSSQFAGTLNTNKLYDVMLEAMEKTLSFDISSALILNSLSQPVFNLNTIYTPTENLINALKIRSVLNYKNTTEDNSIPNESDFNKIETIQSTKQTRSNKTFGLEVINYDSLFAPIKIGEDFFGVIELFRQTPFSQEDVTCFQAITHQVALPLRSAKLYEEITITNKKLEKLEKIKSEFISIVSHELRTPLAAINNSLEIVLSEQAGAITPDTKNFVSMAKRNIERLKGIIQDLLDLSRIQTGKLDFSYKLSNIAPSLELLKNTFQQVADEKNIKIILNICDNLPDIYADTRRLEQIFTNLVSNALKFTSDNGKIEVSATIIDSDEIDINKLVMPKIKPEGKYIKVSVKDTGIGMKEEDIPKIFDKFSQIESSLNRNKGGIGLGLTITKQLVDSHLGAIWVDSKLQEGSTFNVILPFVEDMKMFQMDLSKALINDTDTGIIKIRFKNDINLIETLKENKILVLSKLSKEVTVEKENYKNYYTFIPKISNGSFNALFKTLNEYCLKLNRNDIIISKVYCPLDGVDLNKIMELLNGV